MSGGRPCNTIANIEKRIVKQENGCWFYTGRLHSDGYGECSWAGKTKQVHRLIYEQKIGPIADGLVVRHTCSKNYAIESMDYRRCCNPAHLILGTPAENSADMIAEGRQKVSSGTFKPGDQKGEKNSTAKLTVTDVANIRNRAAEGTRALAAEFGVSQQSIRNVLKNRTW